MRKRLFSILTALCLCLTLLPTAVLAENDGLAKLGEAAELSTDTPVAYLIVKSSAQVQSWHYTLASAVTEAMVQANKEEEVTIVLNGATKTISAEGAPAICSTQPIVLDLAKHRVEGTIKVGSEDGQQTGSLKIIDESASGIYSGSGSIEKVTVSSGSRLTLDGTVQTGIGTISHDTNASIMLLSGNIGAIGGATPNYTSYLGAERAYYAYDSGKMGGILTIAEVEARMQNGVAVAVAPCEHSKGTLSGRDFTCTYCGKKIKNNDVVLTETDGTMTLYPAGKLRDALSAARSKFGCTVKLLTDITLPSGEGGLTVTGKFVLDLNGCTLTVGGGHALKPIGSGTDITLLNTADAQATLVSTWTDARAFSVDDGARLQIGTPDGNSNIVFRVNSSASGVYPNVPAAELRTGTLDIYGGKFRGAGAGLYVYNDGVSRTVLNIHGGTFQASNTDGCGLQIVNTCEASLSGGEYNKISTNGDVFSYLADGSTFSTANSGTGVIDRTNPGEALNGMVYVVPHTHDFSTNAKCACGLSCPHASVDTDTGICNDCKQQVSSVKLTKGGKVTMFNSLPAAVTEAAKVENAGSTIALLTDIDLNDSSLDIGNPDCDFIIDLNGKALKTTGTLFNLLYFGQTLTIINTANKQAKIAAAEAFDIGRVSSVVNIGQSSGHSSIRFDLTETFVKYAEGNHVNAPMTVNIYGGEYRCTGDYALNVSVPYAVADIKGGEFTGKLGGVYAAGSGKLTAAGGKFLTFDTENGYGLIVNGSDAQVALSGGEYQGIQTDTRELSDLLAGGYGFKKENDSWLSTDELARSDIKKSVTVEKAAISSLTVKINGEEVTGDSYVGVIGKAFSLSAVTVPAENDGVKWFQLSEGSKNELTESTFTPVSAAPVTLRCEAQKDGYTIFKDITVTAVDAVGIAVQPTNASVTYGDTALPNELTGLTTEFESGNTVSAQWFVQSSDAKPDIALTGPKDLTSQTAYGEAAFSHTLNAGSYPVYCKMTVSSGSIISTVTSNVVTLTVQPKTLKAQDLEYTGSTNTKVYDGTTSAPAGAGVSVRSGALVGSDTLNVTGTIVYDTKDVTATQLIFTPDAIENGNYRLPAGEVLTVPAGITPKILTEFDFSGIAVTKVYDGGTSIGTLTGTVGFNGKVNTDDIFIKATPGVYADEKVGQNKHVTLALSLEGTNKANYTLSEEDKTHEFTAASIMEADGSVTAPKRVDELRYNGKMQTIVTGGSSTTGEIQYRLGESGTYGTTLPQAKDAGSYTVYYKVVGDSNHKDVEEDFVTVEIKAAELTVTAKDKNAYIGGKAPDLSKPELNKDYTVDGLIGKDHLTKEPILAYDPAMPDMTKIGEAAKIIANGADAGSNYSITYAAGKLILSRRSSSSGSVTYPVNVPDKTENGSVTVSPKNASKGSTVTITVTPDSGYVLETISITDKNGNDLKLTNKGNGKYTFTMPGSKVEVKVTFMEDNSVLNFFYDVPNDAYYYEAVKWAAENGITGGVGNSLFAPNQPCTRAQIVTFLWRAAGSPVVNYLMSFTDVDESAYYAEAVRWAASTGIVTGLTETTFGANGVCTRAQAAAMIYRYAQAQGKGFTGAWMFLLPFTDVPEWAYESVAWCYMNGVTTGVSETSFAPGKDCTRAQIVTFLYRAYQGN